MSVNKDNKIEVRISDELKADFAAYTEHRGFKMAAFLHNFIADTVNEAKKSNPEIFQRKESVPSPSPIEEEKWTVEQPGYEGKFHKKDKEKAS